MNNLILHQIIENIKWEGEFPFGTYDVLNNLDSVLSFFRINDELTQEQKNILKKDLFDIALAEEFREVKYITCEVV